MELTRRNLIASSTAIAAGLAVNSSAMSEISEFGKKKKGEKFRLKYAPHFGMFSNHAGNDPIDQLKFAADEGFHAWEENGMKGYSPADQDKIAKAMHDLGISMGIFVVNPDTAWGNNLTTGKEDTRNKFLDECKSSVEVAKRMNATWMTVVTGTVEPRMEPGYQTANVIDTLRKASEIFEPHGLVMVLEALNYRDHPNLFLTKIAQGYSICRAVNSPSCKLLFDMYHQQIQEGNIIPNINQGYSEIGYFQIGDNPGRNEPTSGEVNYHKIFEHLNKKGFKGILGMEHGNSKKGKEGERAVIDAYRWSDNF